MGLCEFTAVIQYIIVFITLCILFTVRNQFPGAGEKILLWLIYGE